MVSPESTTAMLNSHGVINMSQYKLICETCDVEYSIHTYNEDADVPGHCSFCGSTIPEDNITSSESEDWSDEDWDKLTEESLDDEDWKWENKD